MLSVSNRFFLLILCFAIFVIPAFAQPGVTKKILLRGKVVDPNHAAIPGADVSTSGTGLPRSLATTDRNGEFSLMVQPGEYQVRVAAEGFSEVTETVNPTSSQPIEIVLEVAPSSASVTVTDAYGVSSINSATKTLTPLRDVPQSISVDRKSVV